jgi:hypothetical protein
MATHPRNNRDPLVRQASARHERRERLLAEAIRRHGVAGLTSLFMLLEVALGEEIGIDRRLEALVDASPSAIGLHAARTVAP